jgi:hypothetical protein
VTRKPLGLLIGMVSLVALVLGLALAVPGSDRAKPGAHHALRSSDIHPVLTALTSTTNATSYAFTYVTTFQPGAGPATVTSGHGVVNLDPFVMSTTNSADSAFPGVTAVFDSTDVWEFGAGDYGTNVAGGTSPGNPLPGFATSVEGSLGQGQGALAMVSLASPTGRLNLDPAMLSSAREVGSGTVDGVAVTNYQVTIDLDNELNQAGLSDAQQTTISEALSILQEQGYIGTTEVVSIDAAGFIRQTRTVATFSDGGTVSSDNIISDIGCAGTVTPGRPVPTPAPAGCISPDQATAVSTTTTTTTSVGAAPMMNTTTTTTSPVAPTTVPPANPATTTTVPSPGGITTTSQPPTTTTTPTTVP